MKKSLRLVTVLGVALVFAGGFLVGRRTAPAARAGVVALPPIKAAKPAEAPRPTRRCVRLEPAPGLMVFKRI